MGWLRSMVGVVIIMGMVWVVRFGWDGLGVRVVGVAGLNERNL